MKLYSILCDSRKGQELGINQLALVDRSKTRSYWWTYDNSKVIKTFLKNEAERMASSLMNNAVVVSYERAKTIIQDQKAEIEKSIFDAEYDLSWYAHKDSY